MTTDVAGRAVDPGAAAPGHMTRREPTDSRASNLPGAGRPARAAVDPAEMRA